MPDSLVEELQYTVATLNLALNDRQLDQLHHYAGLLIRWNKTYNLIGRSTERDVVKRHLLDSLLVLAELNDPKRCEHWADIGTGAGLPGIPLAIAMPNTRFTLIDSNSKKTRFLHQVIAELKLHNVQAVHTRVEDHHSEPLYDLLISRAWAAMIDGLRQSAHLCKPGGRICFMKGQKNEQELLDASKQFTLLRCTELANEQAARHLVEFLSE
ncbi:MAG: 16S rRNA (guanine(527)-N(7))-methyltransferase RsmG [Pseudomonadota bacterium]